MHTVVAGSSADAPATAVLAALVGVLGIHDQPGGHYPSESLLGACGTARWLMDDLINYLLAPRRVLQAAATEARIALSANFIQ